MLQGLKKKAVVIPAICAALVALYALAGFVVAPKMIRSALLEDIPKSLGVTPTVGAIRINPFLLEATIDGFALQGRDGGKLVGFDRLFVDFEWSSVWRRALTFNHIDLASPYVDATVARDGRLNLLQLQPQTSQPARAPTNEPLPAVRIGSLTVSRGLVVYEDHSRPDVFAARLEPIDFELRDFTTGVEGGKFTFTGSSSLGERIEWHGHVSAQPMESDGDLRISSLRIHTLWEYLQDRLNFQVKSGTVDLAAAYRFSMGGAAGGRPANLRVDVSTVALKDLALGPRDSDVDWITLPLLTVTGTTVDLGKRQAHADRVAVSGLDVLAWLESDGRINLMRLAAPGPATSAPAAAPGGAADAIPPWRFDLGQLDLQQTRIAAEDRTVHPAVKLLLAPLSLRVEGLGDDLTKPLRLTLDTRVNGTGSLHADGEVTPQPAAATLDLGLAGLDLTVIQPYIAGRSSMTLVGGKLGAELKVHYDAAKKPPALLLSGNIDLQKLHTVDDVLHDDFINWDRLDIQGLNYGQSPDRLDIEQVVARKLYARVIIEPDLSMNIKRVLLPPGAAAAPPVSATPTVQEAATVKAPGTRGAAPMPMSIKKITIHSSQANFTDLSVKPNFSAGIQGLEGTVTGLSSKANSRAKVDLHGSVGEFAPVAITGSLNVLGPQLHTDIGLSFRNMELTIFNPYSGKFAGYDISKGKLTTEMHYKVDDRKLDAQHHIVIDQLEFGDKTASKDAVSLPVKLAVSLLKDRNGIIDLSLPVTGSLDDPKFKLSGVIWQVLVNLLEKAVTAPFALLGSLFGGGPDVQFIDFQPGTGTLDPSAVDKVRAVQRALIGRPRLKIDVPIGVVPDIDRPALIAAELDAELDAAAAVKGGTKKGAPAAPPVVYGQLDPAGQLGVLSRVYAKDFGAEPKFPDQLADLKAKPEIAAARIDFLSTAIRDHIQVGDPELQSLGQQRALAVQQVLLNDPQVTADRVFLVANDKATSKDGLVRLELSLK